MTNVDKNNVISTLYTLQKWYLNAVSGLITSETLSVHIFDQIWTLNKHNSSNGQFSQFTIEDLRLLSIEELLFFGFTPIPKAYSSEEKLEMVMSIPVWGINLVSDGEDLVISSQFSWKPYTKGQNNDENLRAICKESIYSIGWKMTQKEIFDYEIFLRDNTMVSISIPIK